MSGGYKGLNDGWMYQGREHLSQAYLQQVVPYNYLQAVSKQYDALHRARTDLTWTMTQGGFTKQGNTPLVEFYNERVDLNAPLWAKNHIVRKGQNANTPEATIKYMLAFREFLAEVLFSGLSTRVHESNKVVSAIEQFHPTDKIFSSIIPLVCNAFARVMDDFGGPDSIAFKAATTLLTSDLTAARYKSPTHDVRKAILLIEQAIKIHSSPSDEDATRTFDVLSDYVPYLDITRKNTPVVAPSSSATAASTEEAHNKVLAENAKLQSVNIDLRSAIAALESKLNAALAQNATLIENQQSSPEALAGLIARTEAANAELQQRIERLTQGLEEALVNAQEEKNSKLAAEAAARNLRAQFELELKALQEKLASEAGAHQTALEESKAATHLAQQSAQQLEEQIAQMKDEVQSLSAELRTQLDELGTELQTLQSNLESAKQEKIVLESKGAKVTEEAEATNKDLKEKILILERALAQEREEATQIAKDLNDLQDEFSGPILAKRQAMVAQKLKAFHDKWISENGPLKPSHYVDGQTKTNGVATHHKEPTLWERAKAMLNTDQASSSSASTIPLPGLKDLAAIEDKTPILGASAESGTPADSLSKEVTFLAGCDGNDHHE